MDFNNNNENFNNLRENFFQDIDSENLKTSNISGSGISYGSEKTDNTKMILMVFFILFTVVLLVIMAVKLSNRGSKNNIAEIPVIEGYKDIRSEHEMPKPNELYDAGIYKRNKEEKKDDKSPEIEPSISTTAIEIPATALAPVTTRQVETVKTTPVKTVVVEKPVAKKPVVKSKKIVEKPRIKILNSLKTNTKPKLIEKKTEVEGEVEMVMEQPIAKKMATAKVGSWYVQLVSTLSEVSANAAWGKLKSQHPDLFTGKEHKVFKVVVDGKTYYRLRAIGFDVNSATAFCNDVKTAGLTCFVGK